ncbi:MAG: hypothetical protein WD250_10395 [Egibacteraceae bacterium]
MSRVAVDTDWLRRMGALTVEPDGAWPPDQILAARLLVIRLVNSARTVAASTGAADACPSDAATLVAELSMADVPDSGETARGEPADLAAAYLHALCDAAGAVYFCRRVEHASGRCWFSTEGPVADLCGRVLAAGHRCSADH